MANSHPQHRCVFVGNIPYDATEEQLKEICEEVGPVVSFRLVIDRETGKPKGYGFCEYKDEETALSARRNLQGYEINGRQLRVDFAENDKNADRNREQGRGGPGMVSNVVVGDSTLHQPIGVSAAMAAGTVLAQALGTDQTGNQNNIYSQPTISSDPLTLYLAKMSRNQLIEVLSEMKAMATQNKEQVRQLFLACSPLPKAILQALILLGLVPPHMLQIPNFRQASAPSLQTLVQEGVFSQLLAAQNLPGLPSIPQNKVQYNALDTAVSAGHPVSMLNNQQPVVPQFPVRPQIQLSQLMHQNQSAVQSGNLSLPLMRPQSLGKFSFRPQTQVASSLMQHVQNPPFQQSGQVTRPPLLDQGLQHGALFLSGIPDNISKDPRKQVINSIIDESLDPRNPPAKLVRLNDGRPMASSAAENVATSSGSPQMFSISGNQVSRIDEAPASEKQASQVQLPPDVESALLQQVLYLTPEQLSSLPPDQQQQVIQLQKMLRQAS